MSRKRQNKEARIESYVATKKAEKVDRLTREMTRMKNLDPLTFQQSLIKARIQELREDLPHLYGWNWYTWTREFFESRNRMNLLCAANQIGKSSAAIRKNIEWACNKKLWPELWSTPPKQFWYFYPSDEVATIEVEKKWVPEFLPRGEMKNHENYGWDIEYKSGDVSAIHFRSGCSIYFKSYGQKTINLQTSSVHMMTFDEEAPEEIVNECLARLRATRGYFCQIFTATRGLQLWYRAMECIGTEEEVFKDAWKRSVSMRDCMFYEDGTPSPWTAERTKEAESFCTSQSEILKRIDGRFVKARADITVSTGSKEIRGEVYEPATCPTVTPSNPVVITNAQAATLIGMKKAAAIDCVNSFSATHRIAQEDGQSFALTKDYRMDRVDLTINKGIVTKATVG